jgi:hypothetical protein
MRHLTRIGLTVGTLGLALGCIADITGAPCDTQDTHNTCPLGQVCTAAKLCGPVSGLTGSGGGAGGSGTGGGGSSALAPIGAACATDAQCASDWCYTDNPGGECTSDCLTEADCGAAGTCVDEGDGYSTCYLKCTGVQGCRSGYECSSGGICVPQ